MLKIVTYNIECGLQEGKLRENIKSFAKGFKKFNGEIVSVKGSDHKPVIVTLEL